MGTISTISIGSTDHSVYAITSDPVADADAYLAAKIGADAWDSSSSTLKSQAIISAARWIDRVSTFSGTKTVASQPLEWPRDGASCSGTAIADGTTPDDLAYAEFELAFILIGDASAQDASSQGSNVKSAKAGSAEVVFFGATIGTSEDTKLPSPAHDMLKCLLTGAGNSIAGGFSSGTDNDSDFCDTDFDRSGGYY